MNNDYFISIIICTYNSERTVEDTLKCVFRESDIKKEVIIVDDASNDSTVEICKKYLTKIIRLDRNRGPAHCRNEGSKIAKGDILFWIDSDVNFEFGLISKMVKSIELNHSLDGAGSISLPIPLNKGFFSEYFALQEYYLMTKMFGESRDIITSLLCTRCGLLKKSVFDELGGFNEKFLKPSIEDFEFSSRMNGKYKILYSREFLNRHYFPDSFTKIFKRYFINSMLLSRFLTRSKIKSIFFLREDAFVRSLIVFGFFFLFLTLLYRWLLYISIVFLVYAIYKKKVFLKLFIKHKNVYFSLKSLFFYFIFSFPVALGFLCGAMIRLFNLNGNNENTI